MSGLTLIEPSSYSFGLYRLFSNWAPSLYQPSQTQTSYLSSSVQCLNEECLLRRALPVQLSTAGNTSTWDPVATPYPTVGRNESAIETFKSKSRGQVQIKDPYNWLHRSTSESEETRKFIADQNALTQSYLNKYAHRKDFEAALRRNWDFEHFGTYQLYGDGYYYFEYNSGLQSQTPIYRVKQGEELAALKQDPSRPRQKVPGGELFFDPNLLSTDGTVSVPWYVASKSGKFFAYGVSISGSDWNTIYVRSTKSPHPKSAEEGGKRGEDPGRLTDEIKFTKFTRAAWLHDDSGFFYMRFPEKNFGPSGTRNGTNAGPDENAMLYFHKLGDSQEKDTLVLKDSDHPKYSWGIGITDDGKYLQVLTFKGADNSNRLWVTELGHQPIGPDMKWHKIVDTFGNYFGIAANEGTRFHILTDKDAPKYKVVIYDLAHPELGFRDHIPENPDANLELYYEINKNKAIVEYSRDVNAELYLYELSTGRKLKRIGAELIGTIADMWGEGNETFILFSGFLTPGTLYRYKLDAPEGKGLTVFRAPQTDLKPEDFVTKQVFYTSKDGTRIPMFITHHKSFRQDGRAPAFQYGYGGFSFSVTPFYSSSAMTFIARYGAVLAVPNIRGGSEYGEKWHHAGSLEHKQNVFDDFQWASKYLIEQNYTSSSKLTINGGSNGGLLVAACLNQAPELFGAVVAESGVLDMLRYQRFTAGQSWIPEYGDPDDPEAFDYLVKYSPLHNVNSSAKYPATMVMAADGDDRVLPLHSFKFISELQHDLAKNPNPLLLRVSTKSGHGLGTSTDISIQNAVDKYSFVALSLGLEWIQ